MAAQDGLTRRDFIKTGAVAAGAMALSAKSHAQVAGANGRLRVGIIGCGGMASGHLDTLLALKDEDNVDVVAVCDIFRKQADRFDGKVREKGGATDIYADHRQVLDRKDIDYVLIATPEHSHAYITLDALAAGKHVYCEKPLTHTIAEAQAVVKQVQATGLKLQVGVQSMADDSYSSARTAIQEGKIGAVVQAQVDYVRNYTTEGPWRKEKLDGNKPKPEDLDWERWLQPAAAHAWDPHRYEEWRCYADYSGGIATDLFIHRITRILKACNLTFPKQVAGMGGIYTWPDGRDLPDSFELLAEYPAVEGITKGMTLYTLGTMANERGNDHCIRGTEGTLLFTKEGWEIRDDDGKVTQSHKKTGGEDLNPHHKNHHASIRDGAELNCPAELGLYGVALVCMANQSWREKRMLTWDWENGAAV
jgi:predicted dehydrogenase